MTTSEKGTFSYHMYQIVFRRENFGNPFPAEDELQRVALATGLSNLQVKQWLSSYRKKIAGTPQPQGISQHGRWMHMSRVLESEYGLSINDVSPLLPEAVDSKFLKTLAIANNGFTCPWLYSPEIFCESPFRESSPYHESHSPNQITVRLSREDSNQFWGFIVGRDLNGDACVVSKVQENSPAATAVRC